MKIDRDKIAKLLTDKGAAKPCHRCGSNQFAVLEGYSNIYLNKKLSANLAIGGPSVPVTHVACNNCGAITSHALGALGLLPQEEQDSNDG